MNPGIFPDHFSRPVQRYIVQCSGFLPWLPGPMVPALADWAARQPGRFRAGLKKKFRGRTENPVPGHAHWPEYRAPGDWTLQCVYGRPHRFPPENFEPFRPRSPFFAFCSGHIRKPGGKVVQPGMVRARLYQFSLHGLHPREEHTLRRRTPRGGHPGSPVQNAGCSMPGPEKRKKIFNQHSPALRSGSQ
jgi:hypothetical protein